MLKCCKLHKTMQILCLNDLQTSVRSVLLLPFYLLHGKAQRQSKNNFFKQIHFSVLINIHICCEPDQTYLGKEFTQQ